MIFIVYSKERSKHDDYNKNTVLMYASDVQCHSFWE